MSNQTAANFDLFEEMSDSEIERFLLDSIESELDFSQDAEQDLKRQQDLKNAIGLDTPLDNPPTNKPDTLTPSNHTANNRTVAATTNVETAPLTRNHSGDDFDFLIDEFVLSTDASVTDISIANSAIIDTEEPHLIDSTLSSSGTSHLIGLQSNESLASPVDTSDNHAISSDLLHSDDKLPDDNVWDSDSMGDDFLLEDSLLNDDLINNNVLDENLLDDSMLNENAINNSVLNDNLSADSNANLSFETDTQFFDELLADNLSIDTSTIEDSASLSLKLEEDIDLTTNELSLETPQTLTLEVEPNEQTIELEPTIELELTLEDEPTITNTTPSALPTSTSQGEVEQDISDKESDYNAITGDVDEQTSDYSEFDAKVAAIKQNMQDFQKKMQDIARHCDEFHSLSSDLIENIRELQLQDDDFSITYEQVYQLRGCMLTARRAFNEVPNFFDVADQAWENDLYTAQMRQKQKR